MGYPTRLLSEDEVIEREFRPHWSGILREGLIILVGIGVAVALWVFEAPGWTYGALALVVLLLIVVGWSAG